MKWFIWLLNIFLVLSLLVAGCAPATPEVVVKEVPVEKKVVETVVVEKEKVVEKPVVETVVVEKEKPVTVMVEKKVVETVEVEKEVIVEVTPWSCEQAHIVKYGDSLESLAEKYLGNASAADAIIYYTNLAHTGDPSYASLSSAARTSQDFFHPGWKICIPSPKDAEAFLPEPEFLLLDIVDETTLSGEEQFWTAAGEMASELKDVVKLAAEIGYSEFVSGVQVSFTDGTQRVSAVYHSASDQVIQVVGYAGENLVAAWMMDWQGLDLIMSSRSGMLCIADDGVAVLGGFGQEARVLWDSKRGFAPAEEAGLDVSDFGFWGKVALWLDDATRADPRTLRAYFQDRCGTCDTCFGELPGAACLICVPPMADTAGPQQLQYAVFGDVWPVREAEEETRRPAGLAAPMARPIFDEKLQETTFQDTLGWWLGASWGKEDKWYKKKGYTTDINDYAEDHEIVDTLKNFSRNDILVIHGHMVQSSAKKITGVGAYASILDIGSKDEITLKQMQSALKKARCGGTAVGLMVLSGCRSAELLKGLVDEGVGIAFGYDKHLNSPTAKIGTSALLKALSEDKTVQQAIDAANAAIKPKGIRNKHGAKMVAKSVLTNWKGLKLKDFKNAPPPRMIYQVSPLGKPTLIKTSPAGGTITYVGLVEITKPYPYGLQVLTWMQYEDKKLTQALCQLERKDMKVRWQLNTSCSTTPIKETREASNAPRGKQSGLGLEAGFNPREGKAVCKDNTYIFLEEHYKTWKGHEVIGQVVFWLKP
jgi:hypothetical protein